MSKQAQKKEHMCVPFWRFGVVHLNIKKTLACSFLAPRCGTPYRIFQMRSGTRTPKNSVVCKLVYIDTTRPIRKKCRGTMCRRTVVRQGSKTETDKKKNTSVFFLAPRCGTPQHKKKNTCVFFFGAC